MNRWGKIKAAATYAGVSERTFRKWLKTGLEHSRLPSGTILIRYSNIDKFLEGYSTSANEVDDFVDSIMAEVANGN